MGRRRALQAASASGSHSDTSLPALQLSSDTENRPALGQDLSGDALIVLDHGHLGLRIALDEAGHGPVAHSLSSAAAAVIRRHLQDQIAALPLSEDGLVPLNRNESAAI